MARRRFLPALRRSGLETKSVLSLSGYGRSTMPVGSTGYGMYDRAATWDIEKATEEGYERGVWTFKSIELIAGHASRLPFQILTDDDKVDSHPLLRVMNRRANPMETGKAFRKRLAAQLLLSKKGVFVEVTKSRAGRIARLDLLPPDRVRIIPDPGGDYVDYFEFTRYDGEVRNLPPERVRWIREPHPLDPFSGVTPLEAAGLSVDLDQMARIYNTSFMKRDGRPGGIVGVDADGLDDRELERIESRFKPGAEYAGQISVIGTGPGGMRYEDTATKPRDMAYETTSEKAKLEILAAFSVPESLIGNASGRNFDNASQEELNFWQYPMIPFLDLIASAFLEDVEEEMAPGFDTAGIEALELPDKRRREEARQEFDKGLRSVKEYRDTRPELAVIDSPHTRALWLSPSKAPVPAQKEDAAALGMMDPATGAPTEGAAATGGPTPPRAQGETGAEVVAEARLLGGAQEEAPEATEPAAGQAEGAVTEAREGEPSLGAVGAAGEVVDSARQGIEGKALDEGAPQPQYNPGDEELRRVELAVKAALDALLARQLGVVTARIESPKTRKGTRFWAPDGEDDPRAGDKTIDSQRVIDTEKWAEETEETLAPIVGPAGQESAAGLLEALAAAGALTAATGATATVVGEAPKKVAETAENIGQAAVTAAAAPALLAATVAAGAMRDWLNERISDLDRFLVESDPALTEVIEHVKGLWNRHGRNFADSLAVGVAQTAVAGARDEAADGLMAVMPEDGSVPPSEVWRRWQTREDERVRATHEEANGQMRRLGETFDVGGYPVRHPSDPLAPPAVSRWCRCWLIYTWESGAEFRLAPSS